MKNHKGVKMNAKIKIVIFIFCFIDFAFNFTGCVTTPADGIESLVESRLINERDRIRSEFAQELAGWLTEDLGRIITTVNSIGDGQAALRRAVEEYRELFLRTLDQLQQLENQGTKTD